MRLGIVAALTLFTACGFTGPTGSHPDGGDGDAPPPGVITVGFDSDSSVTDEAAGSHLVGVMLSASATNHVSVHYAVMTGGTATPGADFVLADGLLTFDNSANRQDIAIEIKKDSIDEPDESFTIALDSADGATLGRATHVVTISNTPIPRVAFALSALAGAEDSGAHAISVSLDKVASVPITVHYAVTGTGTFPASGADYALADGDLTISAATLGNTIPLVLTEDTLDEEDEQLKITLSAPINAELGNNSVFTYTITDNDAPPTVSLPAAATFAEGTGTTSVTASLSTASGKTVTVPYTVTLGTASASDVTVVGGTLVFAPGATTLPIPVIVLQDALDEDDETFTLVLGTPTNATLANATETVTITDDDATPTVAIVTGSTSVPESVGTVTLDVTLSAPSGRTVTAVFAAGTAGSATEGADFAYTPASHTLTFAPGTTTQQIAIAVTEDTLDEPNETIVTTLVAASTVNATIAGAVNSITITDDDPTCIGPTGAYQVCLTDMPAAPVTLTANLNTTSSPLCLAAQPMGWQANQPDACFIVGTTISIASGTTVKVTGTRPLVLVASDSITIAGTLDVSSKQTGSSGPANDLGCTAYTQAPVGSSSGGGGGAGGGFMTIGGNGGGGGPSGMNGGGPALAAVPKPLRLQGGCDGQRGGNGGSTNAPAGAVGRGGGAVYVLAKNAIDLTGGVIDASGGGGTGGDPQTGGSGGGAGGMIELRATTVVKTPTTTLFANGGGGASGADNSSNGTPGADPAAASYTVAALGGNGSGGLGGRGFAFITQSGSGGTSSNDGGGGGGGGGGLIQSNQSLTGAGVSAGIIDAP